jgi:ribonuclease P protein component
MLQHKNTLRKDERLCNHKLIANLFKNGRYFFEYPFKVWYLLVDDKYPYFGKHPAQILFSVPKRQFRKAVERNFIRRLLKEGYRKNKAIAYDFLESNQKKIVLGLIYSAKTPLTAAEIEQKIIKSLQRLTQTIYKSIIETKSQSHHEQTKP